MSLFFAMRQDRRLHRRDRGMEPKHSALRSATTSSSYASTSIATKMRSMLTAGSITHGV
jgi:hypothetical protein